MRRPSSRRCDNAMMMVVTDLTKRIGEMSQIGSCSHLGKLGAWYVTNTMKCTIRRSSLVVLPRVCTLYAAEQTLVHLSEGRA